MSEAQIISKEEIKEYLSTSVCLTFDQRAETLHKMICGEQMKPKPTPQLPGVEEIAKSIYSIYGDKWPNASGHDKSICMREAKAVLDLLQGKQERTYPACKGKNCGCTDGMSHSKECIAEYAETTKMSAIESARDDQKQPETESQYQERLLRALRDFG